jgi:DNA (cytosine-5)-methyltransferase 1
MKRAGIKPSEIKTLGSFFSGVGGADEAVKRAIPKIEIKYFCEFDKNDSKWLEYEYPNIPNLGDITKIDIDKLPETDAMWGSAPCTDLSFAGLRKGLNEGTRSGLFLTYAKIVKTKKPRIAFYENVPGAYTGDGVEGRSALETVLMCFNEMGYNAVWGQYSALEVGAPHLRKRLFLMASKDGIRQESTPIGEFEDGYIVNGLFRDHYLGKLPINGTMKKGIVGRFER